MYCPNCGASNDDDQLACKACGLPLGRKTGVAADFEPGPSPSSPPNWQAPSGSQPPPGYQPGPGDQRGPWTGASAPQSFGAGWRTYQPSYAGFWKRFAAYFIDGVILNIVLTIIGYVIGVGYVANLREAPAGRAATYSLISLVLTWLYFALMESSKLQATVGKMALGIVVTDTEGDRIGLARASVRWWSKILSGLILMIGYIMAAFSERKQALHDHIAGTFVINKR